MWFFIVIISLIIILMIISVVLQILSTITATSTTNAIIIAYNEHIIYREDKNGFKYKQDTKYVPVFEYYVDGKKYIQESFIYEDEPNYNIGQEVQINYREKNPQDAYLKADKKKKIINIWGVIPIIVFCIIILYIFIF